MLSDGNCVCVSVACPAIVASNAIQILLYHYDYFQIVPSLVHSAIQITLMCVSAVSLIREFVLESLVVSQEPERGRETKLSQTPLFNLWTVLALPVVVVDVSQLS